MSSTNSEVMPTEAANRSTNALFLLAASVLIVSFATPLMRVAQEAGMPSIVIAGGRLLLAFLFLTPIVLQQHRDELKLITRSDLVLAVAAGFWCSVNFLLSATALEYTALMVAQVIINTNPLWVAGLEIVFLKARFTKFLYIGLLIVFIGGGIIAFSSITSDNAADASNDTAATEETTTVEAENERHEQPILGAMLALGAAIAGASYMTIGRKVREKVSILPYVWVVYGAGALTSIIAWILSGTSVTGYEGAAYFWVLVLAVGPQLIAHTGFNYAVGFFPATFISITSQVVSVLAATIAFFLFAEVPSALEAIGSVIIIGGVIVAITGSRKKAKAA